MKIIIMKLHESNVGIVVSQRRNDPSCPCALYVLSVSCAGLFITSTSSLSSCHLSWFMSVAQDSGKKPWHSLKIDASLLRRGQKSSFSTFQHLLSSSANLFWVFMMIWFKPKNFKVFLLLLLLFGNFLIVSSFLGIPQVNLITWLWSKLSVC